MLLYIQKQTKVQPGIAVHSQVKPGTARYSAEKTHHVLYFQAGASSVYVQKCLKKCPNKIVTEIPKKVSQKVSWKKLKADESEWK